MTAQQVAYDNSVSELVAQTVQDAIDELASKSSEEKSSIPSWDGLPILHLNFIPDSTPKGGSDTKAAPDVSYNYSISKEDIDTIHGKLYFKLISVLEGQEDSVDYCLYKLVSYQIYPETGEATFEVFKGDNTWEDPQIYELTINYIVNQIVLNLNGVGEVTLVYDEENNVYKSQSATEEFTS